MTTKQKSLFKTVLNGCSGRDIEVVAEKLARNDVRGSEAAASLAVSNAIYGWVDYWGKKSIPIPSDDRNYVVHILPQYLGIAVLHEALKRATGLSCKR